MYACGHEDPDNKLDIRKTNEAVMLYAAANFSETGDVLCVFDLIRPDVHVSDDFLKLEDKSEGERVLHLEMIKAKGQKLADIEVGLRKVFMLVWGQCTKALQAGIQGEEAYIQAKQKYDCVWLLAKIRAHMMAFVETDIHLRD